MPLALEAQILNHWTAREVPHSPLIFNKGPENIQGAENSLFNKWCWDN